MTAQPSLLPINEYENEKVELSLADLPANEMLPSAAPGEGFVKDIALRGITTPIQVAHLTDGTMLVLAGRRRIKALRALGKTTVPAIVYRNVPLNEAYGMLSAENNQRTDNPMADVESIIYFKNQGITDERALAALTGMPLETLRARMRLITLKPELREAVKDGKMTMGAAEEAAKLSQERQQAIVEKIPTKKNGKVTATDVREARQVATKASVAAFNSSLPTVPVPAPKRIYLKVLTTKNEDDADVITIMGGPFSDKESLEGIEGELYYLTKA